MRRTGIVFFIIIAVLLCSCGDNTSQDSQTKTVNGLRQVDTLTEFQETMDDLNESVARANSLLNTLTERRTSDEVMGKTQGAHVNVVTAKQGAILLDESGWRVVLQGLRLNDIGDICLDVLVENNDATDRVLQARDVAANNYMATDPLFSAEVYAGMQENCVMEFMDLSEKADINDIDDLYELKFQFVGNTMDFNDHTEYSYVLIEF